MLAGVQARLGCVSRAWPMVWRSVAGSLVPVDGGGVGLSHLASAHVWAADELARVDRFASIRGPQARLQSSGWRPARAGGSTTIPRLSSPSTCHGKARVRRSLRFDPDSFGADRGERHRCCAYVVQESESRPDPVCFTLSERLSCGGRYWDRTSDLFGVNEARYRCANRPRGHTIAHAGVRCTSTAAGGAGARGAGRSFELWANPR